MKISWNWLSRFADTAGIDPVVFSRQFTLGVAEIDEVHRVGVCDPGLDEETRQHVLSRICIARVTACRPHPQADKLQIVTLDTGDGTPREIVSGAPNARTGLLSVFADEGAVLVGKDGKPFELKEAVIRGVPSRGMLVSFAELGIGEDHGGVIEVPEDLAPGTLLSDVAFAFDDVIWDIDNKSLTHRPDCWGHVGLAREVAALLRRDFTWQVPPVQFPDTPGVKVLNEAPDLCPRYSAFEMDDVRIGPSPLWIQVLLWRLGQRPINNLVDFTNLTMLTVGNPLHAFDRRRIGGDTIVVRRAKEAEPFVTLDERSHILCPQDLVIADATEPVALAGVMGGLHSQVEPDTTRIVLESANFHAGTIRRTALRTGLRTDSSARFEKSLDPHQVRDASCFFADLVLTHVPGSRVSSRYEDVFPGPPVPVVIQMTGSFVEKRLGLELKTEVIAEVLERLQFGVKVQGDDLTITVPSFRATKDIAIPEDIVEEVGRWFGYDNIRAELPSVRLSRPFSLPVRSVQRHLRDMLVLESGFMEAMTYSFNRISDLVALGLDPEDHLEMANPISSEEPVLRTSLFPNLLSAVVRNERHEDHQRLVEFGRVYLTDESGFPRQPRQCALVLANRHAGNTPDLFYHMKDVLSRALRTSERGEVTVEILADPAPFVHPVRSAEVRVSGIPVGWFGQLHPQTRRSLEMESGVVMASLDLEILCGIAKVVRSFEPLLRFPGMSHDISVLVDKTKKAGDLQRELLILEPELVRKVECFAVYESDRYPDRRSLSFRLHLAHRDRTLTQEDLLSIHERALEMLRQQFDAHLTS